MEDCQRVTVGSLRSMRYVNDGRPSTEDAARPLRRRHHDAGSSGVGTTRRRRSFQPTNAPKSTAAPTGTPPRIHPYAGPRPDVGGATAAASAAAAEASEEDDGSTDGWA